VRYKTETKPLYVNVGQAFNDGKYHIYDITQKIKDTANRINGLERPKPNEGYAQKNDVSNEIISKNIEKSNSFSKNSSKCFCIQKGTPKPTDAQCPRVTSEIETNGVPNNSIYHSQKKVRQNEKKV
jgi:hypothetical protein